MVALLMRQDVKAPGLLPERDDQASPETGIRRDVEKYINASIFPPFYFTRLLPVIRLPHLADMTSSNSLAHWARWAMTSMVDSTGSTSSQLTRRSSVPQVPYSEKGSQYGYPSPDGLRNGGPTLWICGLFVALYAITTSVYPLASFFLLCLTKPNTLYTSRSFGTGPPLPKMVPPTLRRDVRHWRINRLGRADLERKESLRKYALPDTDLDYHYCVGLVIPLTSVPKTNGIGRFVAHYRPTFLSAANFIILGHLVREAKGERYSRLSPRNCKRTARAPW